MKNSFNRIIIFGLISLAVLTVLCICLACRMDTNTATMISGGLSAFATAILGIIAVLQNKKYKEYADEIDTNRLIPYIRIFNAVDKINRPAYRIEVEEGNNYGSYILRIQNISPHFIPAFRVVTYQIDNTIFNIKDENKQDFALNPYETAHIAMYYPNGLCKQTIKMNLEVNNVYGNTYIIDYELTIIEKGSNQFIYQGKTLKKPYLMLKEQDNG